MDPAVLGDIDMKKLSEKNLLLLSYHLFSGLGEYWEVFLKLLGVTRAQLYEAMNISSNSVFDQAVFCLEIFLQHTPSLKWLTMKRFLFAMKKDSIVEDIESLVLIPAKELQESEIKIDYEANHEVKTMEHDTNVSVKPGISIEQIGPCLEESCVEPESTQSVLLSPLNTVVSEISVKQRGPCVEEPCIESALLSPRNTVVSNNDIELRDWMSLNDINEFKLFVQANCIDVKNYRFSNNDSILHYVIISQRINIARWLIDENIMDLNMKNGSGSTPLHLAVQLNNIELTESLLKNGANVNEVDKSYCGPLGLAVRNNNFELTEILVKHGANTDNIMYFADLAVRDCNVKLIEYLFKHGARLDGKFFWRDNFLCNPIIYSNKEIAQSLQLAELLIRLGENRLVKPLLMAVAMNNLPMVELFLKYNADINYIYIDIDVDRWKKKFSIVLDENGFTPLIFAVQNNNFPMVKLLLKYNPDINGKDKSHQTALHHATRQRNYNMVSLLLDNNANVNATDQFRRTALHYSVLAKEDEYFKFSSSSLKVAMCLFVHNADINMKDHWGKEPFEYCSEQQRSLSKLFQNNRMRPKHCS